MNTLGLIILNYNSAEDSIVCVSKLLEFQKKYKIIIVDNCSTDDSYEILKNKFGNTSTVDLIKTNANNGYSAGNNFGIKYAINKYGVTHIGILNPDVIISDELLLGNMLEILDRYPQAAIIGGATKNANGIYNENIAAWNVPTGLELVVDHMLFVPKRRKLEAKHLEKDVLQVGCVIGCFFLAKVSALKKIGFLDENVFLYNEENILGIKCEQHGYQVLLYEKGYYVHNHKYSRGVKIPFRKKIMASHNSYVSRKYLCKKYYSRYFVPLLVIAELLNKIYLGIAYIKNVQKWRKNNDS